jgi:Helix-turn-helix domain
MRDRRSHPHRHIHTSAEGKSPRRAREIRLLCSPHRRPGRRIYRSVLPAVSSGRRNTSPTESREWWPWRVGCRWRRRKRSGGCCERGTSFRVIGRRLGRSAATIQQYVGLTGGAHPRERSRSANQLSLGEREEISRGMAAGESMRAVAGRLGRSPSTMSRELVRNGGRRRYRAATAARRGRFRSSCAGR